jgi:hypothetical protein
MALVNKLPTALATALAYVAYDVGLPNASSRAIGAAEDGEGAGERSRTR